MGLSDWINQFSADMGAGQGNNKNITESKKKGDAQELFDTTPELDVSKMTYEEETAYLKARLNNAR